MVSSAQGWVNSGVSLPRALDTVIPMTCSFCRRQQSEAVCRHRALGGGHGRAWHRCGQQLAGVAATNRPHQPSRSQACRSQAAFGSWGPGGRGTKGVAVKFPGPLLILEGPAAAGAGKGGQLGAGEPRNRWPAQAGWPTPLLPEPMLF